ncbi:MAG: hypothetical protein KIC49_11375 [Pseudomonas fluorescens]|nr:hypothetical protein [Pseudomonas fluorescens]
MSYNVTQNAVDGELQILEVLFRSIPKGLDSMEYTLGECSSLILCLSRLKLISDEQKEGYLNELERLHAIGLDQREINASRSASD